MSDAHILPVSPPSSGTEAEPLVETELPEQTDNSVKPEDGEQDVDQSPLAVPGSQTEEGVA